jgi:hypothetical protein
VVEFVTFFFSLLEILLLLLLVLMEMLVLVLMLLWKLSSLISLLSSRLWRHTPFLKAIFPMLYSAQRVNPM